VFASGQHSTVHDLAGRVIATHRVYGHSNHLRPQLSVNCVLSLKVSANAILESYKKSPLWHFQSRIGDLTLSRKPQEA
ncbi:MAG TPA: hypothetical protein PKA48_16560, partial [Candidatus Obscuribacter sp.]|nr:hypothetical protein [Candidatus Obscuribacter sp.]